MCMRGFSKVCMAILYVFRNIKKFNWSEFEPPFPLMGCFIWYNTQNQRKSADAAAYASKFNAMVSVFDSKTPFTARYTIRHGDLIVWKELTKAPKRTRFDFVVLHFMPAFQADVYRCSLVGLPWRSSFLHSTSSCFSHSSDIFFIKVYLWPET